MNRSFALAVAALWLPGVSLAQATVDLPEYTPQQRWERAALQATVLIVAGIAYAKSKGQSAEEYGEFLAEVFAPGWGEPNSGLSEISRMSSIPAGQGSNSGPGMGSHWRSLSRYFESSMNALPITWDFATKSRLRESGWLSRSQIRTK